MDPRPSSTTWLLVIISPHVSIIEALPHPIILGYIPPTASYHTIWTTELLAADTMLTTLVPTMHITIHNNNFIDKKRTKYSSHIYDCATVLQANGLGFFFIMLFINRLMLDNSIHFIKRSLTFDRFENTISLQIHHSLFECISFDV